MFCLRLKVFNLKQDSLYIAKYPDILRNGSKFHVKETMVDPQILIDAIVL